MQAPYTYPYMVTSDGRITTEDRETGRTVEASAPCHPKTEHAGFADDAERYALAVEYAETVRARNERTARAAAKIAPTIESQSVSLSENRNRGEPFGEEKIYTRAVLTLPRVGTVRVDLETDRYTASDGWSEWRGPRVGNVRTVEEDGGYGKDAPGVGDAARETIRAVLGPVITHYLESEEYAAARRIAAARVVRRLLAEPPRDYNINQAERFLEKVAEEIGPQEYQHLFETIAALERVAEMLEKEPTAD